MVWGVREKGGKLKERPVPDKASFRGKDGANKSGPARSKDRCGAAWRNGRKSGSKAPGGLEGVVEHEADGDAVAFAAGSLEAQLHLKGD